MRVVYCDANHNAEEVHNPKGANVAILGTMMGADEDTVDVDDMIEAIREELGERKLRFLEGNKSVLLAGMAISK